MGYPLILRNPGILGQQGAPATFPTVEEVLSQQFSTGSTTHNVNMPTTVNSGELLLVLTTGQHATIARLPTMDVEWTNIYNGLITSGALELGGLGLFAKVADGTEGGTTENVATENAETMAVQVYRISGWWGALAGLEAAALTAQVDTSTPDPPSLSPSWGSAKTLWIAVTHGVNDDATLASVPTNYTNGVGVITGGGTDNGGHVHTARRELEAASEDPGTFSISEAERVRNSLIAVRPAA